jgi:hypothetical protein
MADGGHRIDIAKVMAWGRALVDTNRAHKPVPTGLGREFVAPPPVQRPRDGAQAVASAQSPPPPAQQQSQQQEAAARGLQGVRSGATSPAMSLASAVSAPRSHATGQSGTGVTNAGSAGPRIAPRDEVDRLADALPPLRAEGHRSQPPQQRPTYDGRSGATGRQSGREGGDTPLSVLSNQFEDSPVNPSVAPVHAERSGEGPRRGDERPSAFDRNAAGSPRRHAVQQPAHVSSQQRHGQAERVTLAQRQRRVQDAEAQLAALQRDEDECGRCVAILSSAAGDCDSELDSAKSGMYASVAALPVLGDASSELLSVSAKLSTQLRELPFTGGVAAPPFVSALLLPDPPAPATFQALSSVQLFPALAAALADYTERVTKQHLQAHQLSVANAAALQRTLTEATYDFEQQAAIVDSAHETLAALVEEVERMERAIAELQLAAAGRKRRASDVAADREERAGTLSILRQEIRDLAAETKKLQQQRQRAESASDATEREAARLEASASDALSRRDDVEASLRLSAEDREAITASEELDRKLRQSHLALDDLKRSVARHAQLREAAVERLERMREQMQYARAQLEAAEDGLSALRREMDVAKNALRTATGQLAALEAEHEEAHQARLRADAERLALQSQLTAASKRKDTALRAASDATDRAALIELALKRHEVQRERHQTYAEPPLAFSPPTPEAPRRGPVADTAPSAVRSLPISRSPSAPEDVPLAKLALTPPAEHLDAVALPPTQQHHGPVDGGAVKARRWGRSSSVAEAAAADPQPFAAAQHRSAAVDTAAALQLIVSPERAPLLVAMQPRMYPAHGRRPSDHAALRPADDDLMSLHTRLSADDGARDGHAPEAAARKRQPTAAFVPSAAEPPVAVSESALPRIPSLLRSRGASRTNTPPPQATAPPTVRAAEAAPLSAAARLFSAPPTAAPVSRGRSPSAASSVYSAPADDYDASPPPQIRSAYPSPSLFNVELPSAQASSVGAPRSAAEEGNGGGGMAAIQARLQLVLSRRQRGEA